MSIDIRTAAPEQMIIDIRTAAAPEQMIIDIRTAAAPEQRIIGIRITAPDMRIITKEDMLRGHATQLLVTTKIISSVVLID